MDGPTGLDYQGVIAAAQMAGTTITPELFDGIQIAERAWLDALHERRKAHQAKAQA